MKKLILIFGIILLAGCSKYDCISFKTVRTDYFYHGELRISSKQFEPHYFMKYDISKVEAERICELNTFTLPRKKVVSPIKVFGVVYPYYNLEMTQICKIQK